MENIQQLQQQFSRFNQWEERYRYLIQLGKKLPSIEAGELEKMPLIQGCEAEVRFLAQKDADTRSGYHFSAYSEARIINGLLYLLLSALQDLSLNEIRQFDLTALLQQSGLAQRSSQTRLNGLKNIETRLRHLD